MYFFDLLDYYYVSPAQQTAWQQNGFGGAGVGCAGGPLPNDYEDYYATARATTDAFLKGVNEWFLASYNRDCDKTIFPDDGCVNRYDDLLDEHNILTTDMVTSQAELMYTLPLHEYYYNWYYSTKDTDPLWDMTYPEYINYWVNIRNGGGDCRTGTTTDVWSMQVFCPTTVVDIPTTFNYGTSFTKADLQAKVTKYENSIKAFMCHIKKMMSIMDGDTFDEYIYDSNGNYNINKIGML